MSQLVVIAYPDEQKAAQVLDTVKQMQNAYLVDLEDAAYVTKDASGKLHLHQANDLTGAGAAGGALWGMLFGLLFFVPFLGLAVGAATGALIGHFADYGIDDKFAKQVTDQMKPNSSAIFVVVRKATPDKVIPELAKYGGTIMQTSLSKEAEDKLQAALSAGPAANAGTTGTQPTPTA